MRQSLLSPAAALVATLALVTACSSPAEPPILPGVVVSVAIQPSRSFLTVGDRLAHTVSLLDGAGHPVTNRPISFSSSNESVASVDATGVVRALAVGETTITATSEGRSG
jgi:uncharacterized protein YjdB